MPPSEDGPVIVEFQDGDPLDDLPAAWGCTACIWRSFGVFFGIPGFRRYELVTACDEHAVTP